MSWTGFFEGIEDIAEVLLIGPYDALRELEASSWWAANGLNWIFMLICAAAIVYWIMELKKYDDEGEERKDAISHGFLGKESDLEHKL